MTAHDLWQVFLYTAFHTPLPEGFLQGEIQLSETVGDRITSTDKWNGQYLLENMDQGPCEKHGDHRSQTYLGPEDKSYYNTDNVAANAAVLEFYGGTF